MAVSAGVAVGVHAGAVYVGYSVRCMPGTHDGWRGDLSVDLRFAQGRPTSPAESRPDVAR
jgi:hypothetical protein